MPLSGLVDKPEHLAQLEAWMRSYRLEELFDDTGRLLPELQALAPQGDRRMGANPHANGGRLRRELEVPDYRSFALEVPEPGGSHGEATRAMGQLLRDVIRQNPETFRLMGPDEPCPTASTPCSRWLTGRGWRTSCPRASTWRMRAG